MRVIRLSLPFAVSLVALLAVPPAAQPSQPSVVLEPAAASQETLRRVAAESDVETVAQRPGLAQYLRDASDVLLAWLVERLERHAPGLLGSLGFLARSAAQALFLAGVALLLYLLARALASHLGGQASPRSPPQTLSVQDAEDPEVLGRCRDDWADELRHALDRGDANAALEALWWWLARSLAGSTVERSWTSREILNHAGRWELMPYVRRLDRMIYGIRQPAAGDVRRLWDELREAAG